MKEKKLTNCSFGKVSVIVNCHNGEKYISKCIESILNQTYKNFEIIFWDNKSSDNSSEIVNRYKDYRIKCFYSNNHTNLYAARKEAIKVSSGDYIAFLDVDDYWLSDNLEKQIPLFEDPKVGFVSSNFFIKIEKADKLICHKKILSSGLVLSELLQNYSVGLLTLIIRRTSLDHLNFFFDHRYNYIGDFDMVIRLAANFKMGRTNEPLSVYRIHDNNESKKFFEKQISEFELWYNEMLSNIQISSDIKFKYVFYKILFLKGMYNIYQGKRLRVLYYLFKIHSLKMKFKLFLAFLLPLYILRKLKNYSSF
jgi:glycosyltransferase involved in cell wall biosynthesis